MPRSGIQLPQRRQQQNLNTKYMRLLLINFLQALRHIRRNKWQTFLVVGILSFAMAAFVFSAAGIWKVTHEANEIPDSEDVYTVQACNGTGRCKYHITIDETEILLKNIPADIMVGKMSRFRQEDRLMATVDTTYGHTIATVNPGFFNVIQPEFIYGRPVEKEDEVVLTDKAAIAMFGTDELVGSVVEMSLSNSGTVPLRVCGIVREDKLSQVVKHSAYVYRQMESQISIAPFTYMVGWTLIFIRTEDTEEIQTLLNENNTNGETKVCEKVNLVPIGMYNLMLRESSFWKAAIYPSVFLILSALLLASALSSYLALLTHNAENRWTEHRLRLSFGAASDTLRRIYAEVLLMFMCIGLCTGIILELGYDSFLKYMQMPECDVMQWFAGVWTGMLAILMILCTIPVYLQNRKYHRAISGAPQGKPSLFNYGFVLTQVTVSVLLLFLVWNAGRQLHYVCNDALGFNAKDVYTLSVERDEDKALLRENEFAYEMSQIAAVDTCIMLRPFFNPQYVTGEGFDGYIHSLVFINMTRAGMRMFDIKPNWWKPVDEDTELTKQQALVSVNCIEYFGVTPEKPYMPNGKIEVLGTIDINIEDLHKEPRYFAYSTRYIDALGRGNVPYFRFHPGKEKEGIAAVEDLLRRRDINVDAGLVRVVNCGDLISDTYEKEQNYLTLYTILAFVGFGIAFFGLLTLVSAGLQRQRRSLAIRRIFGATYSICLGKTLRTYLLITFIGSAMGLCIGYIMMTMWLETYSEQITLGVMPALCIIVLIVSVVSILVAYKVKMCFKEPPATVIAG